ncbi:MAG: TolC family protein [Opitutaceae bacterium]
MIGTIAITGWAEEPGDGAVVAGEQEASPPSISESIAGDASAAKTDASDTDELSAGGAGGKEEETVPVELLLAEDLFPQLRPILLSAAQQAPSILSRNVEVAIAEANSVIANADRYPSAAGLLRYDYRKESRLDRPDIDYSNKLFYFFQASYPLYHWGAIQAAGEIGKIGIELAEGQMESAYRQLVQSVRSQYLGLVIQKMDLKNAEADLEKRRNELADLKEQLEAGAIAANRVGSAGFSLQEAELRYDRQASEFAYSLRQFGRLVGDLSFSQEHVADEFPGVGHNPEQLGELLGAFVHGGFKDDPRVMATELEIEREEMNYRIHNVRNRPKFNLITGISQDEISYDANIANKYQTTALFAGVSLNWNIFDGYETRGLRTASLLRLNRLRMSRREMDAQLADEAAQASDRVSFAARALALGEVTVNGVRRALEIAERDFAAGLTSEESVESARGRLFDYEISQARRKVDYLNAVSAFVALVGADTLIGELEENRPELGTEYERKP